jgi:hypothetical protein
LKILQTLRQASSILFAVSMYIAPFQSSEAPPLTGPAAPLIRCLDRAAETRCGLAENEIAGAFLESCAAATGIPAEDLRDMDLVRRDLGYIVETNIKTTHRQATLNHTYAMPYEKALARIEAICRQDGKSIVEVGAGSGYWSHMLGGRARITPTDPCHQAYPFTYGHFSSIAEEWKLTGQDAVKHCPDKHVLMTYPATEGWWMCGTLDAMQSGQTLLLLAQQPEGFTAHHGFYERLRDDFTCREEMPLLNLALPWISPKAVPELPLFPGLPRYKRDVFSTYTKN